jgi:hypothetical protein
MTCSTVTPSLPSKKVTTAIDVAAHRFPPRELAAQGKPIAFLADSSRPAEKSSGPARAPIQAASFRLLQSFKARRSMSFDWRFMDAAITKLL